MCGIVGYGGFTKRLPLDSAVECIKHRGPDGSGIEYFKNAGLGNTRLAIIDLSPTGHQPMFNRDKTLCITFNGEIYNFKEVKKELEKKYSFQSSSDTEIILCAYQEWGVNCLQKFNGMFSFVIYDIKKDLLFGARDRLGQKPLKYYYADGRLIFASEIKAILSLLNSKPELDEVAIDDFLTLQYVPAPKTGFENIYKLPSAHYFIYKNGKFKKHRYWQLNFTKKLDLQREDWHELIFLEMEKAVKAHLVSDVPVGALLSGGLDSSIVVALMAQNSSRKIKTFSVGFDDERFDETKYADAVSRMYGTEHTKFQVKSDDLLKYMNSLAHFYDEPIADNSILPTLLVSELTSSKVKVALTGDGGDENFAGYDRYNFVNLAYYLSKSHMLLTRVFGLTGKTAFKLYPNKFTERMKRFLSSLDDEFYRKYVDYNCFFTNSVKRKLYTREFKQAVDRNDTFNIYHDFYNDKLTDLDNALNIDINTYLPDDLLYKSDTASMASGLELRAPFLDHILMEKIAAMPSDMKLKFISKKKILKEIAVKKNLLPKEVIFREKQGFNIPQNKWFKGKLKDYVYETILISGMIGKIFDKEKTRVYLDNYYQTDLNYDNNIFALLFLANWINKYF